MECLQGINAGRLFPDTSLSAIAGISEACSVSGRYDACEINKLGDERATFVLRSGRADDAAKPLQRIAIRHRQRMIHRSVHHTNSPSKKGMNYAHRPSDRKIIDAYFKAMQAGSAAEDDLMALFAVDAIYIEPFGGEVRTHTGKQAIHTNFKEWWKQAPPDMDGDRIRSEWTCTSPVFPGPMRGFDFCTIRDGKIARLVVGFLPPPGG